MFGIMARPPEEIRRRLNELIERCTKFRAHHDGAPDPQGPMRFQMPTFEQWRLCHLFRRSETRAAKKVRTIASSKPVENFT